MIAEIQVFRLLASVGRSDRPKTDEQDRHEHPVGLFHGCLPGAFARRAGRQRVAKYCCQLSALDAFISYPGFYVANCMLASSGSDWSCSGGSVYDLVHAA